MLEAESDVASVERYRESSPVHATTG